MLTFSNDECTNINWAFKLHLELLLKLLLSEINQHILTKCIREFNSAMI